MRHNKSVLRVGPLEAQVLMLVHGFGEATVRQVYDCLRRNRPIAYTTVMTIMTNLFKKGLLFRDTSETAYRYSLAITKREMVITSLLQVMEAFGLSRRDFEKYSNEAIVRVAK